jgi:hypothetical protein
MPYSISTLLTRNLHDVFGENDFASARGHRRDLHRRLRILRPQQAPTVAATTDRWPAVRHHRLSIQPIAARERAMAADPMVWAPGESRLRRD